MKKIYFSSLSSKSKVNIWYEELDLHDLNELNHSYDIKEILKVDGPINIEKIGDIYKVNFNNDISLKVFSSISNDEFDYSLKLEDELYFTDEENLESDDVFYDNGSFIDLDYYLYSLIVTSLPSKLIKEGETYPEFDDFRVISEDELEEEREKDHSSPFDILENLDLD